MSHYQNKRKHLSSSNEGDAQTANPLYRAQGLVAVHKPLTWTSQDVVSYIRGILTRDAQDRNALGGGGGGQGKRGKRKKQMLKVGHGGTLDPLASGVLVLGIGSGTTKLQSYLEGSKQYVAACELGYETTTLDAEGDIVKQMEFNQITSISNIEEVLPKFRGEISQVPPLYSAIRVDGKRLYEIARKGEKKGDGGDTEVEIPTRQVVVHELEVGTSLDDDVIESGVVNGREYREVTAEKKKQMTDEAVSKVEDVDNDEGNKNDHRGKKQGKYNKNKNDKKKNMFSDETIPMISSADGKLELPQFTLKMSCGGGTYVRSLVRDIGYECGSVATMTGLVRTKQGPFLLSDALKKEDWTADSIYNAIERNNESVEAKDDKVEAKA